MKLQQKTDHIIKFLHSYRVIVIWLIILGLVGFTLWQSLKISDPQIDKAYLEQKRSELKKEAIDVEMSSELETTINNLHKTPVETEPGDTGTQDPFNP